VFVLVTPALFVFLWMLSLALKPDVENTAYPPIFIPRSPTLDSFRQILDGSPIGRYTMNSAVVAGGSTVIALVLGVPAGYGIAKSQKRGMLGFVLIARMTPALSYLIPWFIMFRAIGLNNTLTALVITHLVIGLPVVIWVMVGFFDGLPRDLEEAAAVDGASPWQAFWHVALPLGRPGIVVASLLAFIFSWNNFIFAVVLAGRETRTLPVLVFNTLTFERLAFGPLAAAAILVTLPVLIVTVLVQRQIVVGMTAGAVKS
jgi:multiple sugar transport system permease protein